MPSRSTNTTVTIRVTDVDDLDPKFSHDLYKARVVEYFPMPVSIYNKNFIKKKSYNN